MEPTATRFDGLTWTPDRMLLGDLVFRLEHYRTDDWPLGDECFRFFKIRELVDQYRAFFARRPDLRPRHVLELGIWDGGSAAMWFEILHPERLAAVDLATRQDSSYFQRYVESRGLRGRLHTHWATDQADSEAIKAIVQDDLDGLVDLVIDDGSHLYTQTKASFECLFPFLAPGALYIIEDWAWAHWPEFQTRRHPWAQHGRSLTDLIFELVEATGSSKTLISSLVVYEGFAVVERGSGQPDLGHFRLSNHIVRPRWWKR